MVKILMLSQSARAQENIISLPNRILKGVTSPNYLVSSKEQLLEFLDREDTSDYDYIMADSEFKNNYSIFNELYKMEKIKPKLITYKPNDFTIEAINLHILNYFENDLSGKIIGVYGTGNLAFKTALKLSEQTANIYLYGRNSEKINICISALKQISFNANFIKKGEKNIKLDAIVSCVSSEGAIDDTYIKLLDKGALCLDVGIGNFTKKFISEANKKECEVRRLDVRQSQEIVEGFLKANTNSMFSQIFGRKSIYKETVVAGGILGQEGEIIVDRIKNPTKVIGIANGIGGVKNESEINDEEHEKIHQVQSYIEQNI